MKISPGIIVGGIAALAVGGIGYAIYHDVHTGTKTSTLANSMFNSYRKNYDDHLDLRDNNAWRGSETLRTSTYRSGDWIMTDVYSNRALLEAADGLAGLPKDSQVTKPELQALYKTFDADGNDRLQAGERKPLNRLYGPGGEQLVDHSSYWSPDPNNHIGSSSSNNNSSGTGHTAPGDGPGGTAGGDGP